MVENLEVISQIKQLMHFMTLMELKILQTNGSKRSITLNFGSCQINQISDIFLAKNFVHIFFKRKKQAVMKDEILNLMDQYLWSNSIFLAVSSNDNIDNR